MAKLKAMRNKNFIDRDRGWNKIRNQLIGLRNGRAVAVGIQGSEAADQYPDGAMTNVRLGAIHEFGTADGRVPERSFIRSTFDAEGGFKVRMNKLAKAALAGASAIGQLMLIGEQARAAILRKIKSNIPPPLKPVTIKRKKGETTSLINTGQLWNSISYMIVDPKRKRSIT